MIKQAAISIRVESELKERVEAEAQQQGMTFAAYVASVLAIHSRGPAWVLKDPEVVHTSQGETKIMLKVVEGWPRAMLSPTEAEALAKQLQQAAKAAQKLLK